jgi:undecaprenyl-diphosphatase
VVTGLPSDPDAQRFALMLLIAFLPAVVMGGLFGDFVKQTLYTTPWVIAISFIAGGIVMLLVERYRPAPSVVDAEHASPGRAFGIGLCQVLAMVPGVSRSGATIVGGMLMRLDRPAAAEFSFFLAMPTMTAAFVHDLWEVRGQLSVGRVEEIAVGFVMAFLAALVVVRPFLAVVRRVGFVPFAWYRIAAGLLILAMLARGVL